MIPGDSAPRNYKGEYFVDLGQTLTFSHPKWTWFGFDWFYEYTVNSVKHREYRNGIFED